MRTPTNYRNLRNRCPHCGHRLSMNAGPTCTVENGDMHNPKIITPCRCRKHRRS